MRKLLLIGIMSSFAAGPVVAADLAERPLYKAPVIAPAPYFSWTGGYFGINGGYGWENTQTVYSYLSIPAPAPPGFQDIFGPGGPLNVGGGSAVSSAIARGFLPTSLGQDSGNFFSVGGQFGYNYQMGAYVLGLEADLDWVGGVKTTSYTAPPNGIITNSDTQKAGLQWLGTVRGRLVTHSIAPCSTEQVASRTGVSLRRRTARAATAPIPIYSPATRQASV